MGRDLRDSRILITGASSGIGRALALQAAEAGARLLLAGRNADRLAEAAQEIGGADDRVLTVVGDVTLEEDRHKLLETASERLGGLDVLVNNAGVACSGHFADGSEALLRQVMEVNFFAPAELMRAAVPLLTAGRQPAIVNVCSMCGRRGIPAWSEYSASKFALAGLTEALRGEFARFDIDVLLIVPGLTQTDLQAHLLKSGARIRLEDHKGMSADKVARAILRALRANSSEVWLGTDARWILRIHKFFPRLMDRLLARKVRKLYAEDAG